MFLPTVESEPAPALLRGSKREAGVRVDPHAKFAASVRPKEGDVREPAIRVNVWVTLQVPVDGNLVNVRAKVGSNGLEQRARPKGDGGDPLRGEAGMARLARDVR